MVNTISDRVLDEMKGIGINTWQKLAGIKSSKTNIPLSPATFIDFLNDNLADIRDFSCAIDEGKYRYEFALCGFKYSTKTERALINSDNILGVLR